MVHLGVGNFHRAHQAWYTSRSPDADQWGIAAFTGRRGDTADALRPQDGLYTLITRNADGDSFELVGALSAVHAAAEHEAYLDYLSRPEVAILTITVTEAGYLRGADGHLDAGSIRGYQTIDEAIADPACRSWVETFWDEASRHLTLPASNLASYRAALLTRFANPHQDLVQAVLDQADAIQPAHEPQASR